MDLTKHWEFIKKNYLKYLKNASISCNKDQGSY